MMAWTRRSDFVYLLALITAAFLLLYLTAKPMGSSGGPLSVYSSGKTGIRALYLLSKRLGYKPVIHRQSPILVPKGAKAVFSQGWGLDAGSTEVLRSFIDKALRRGQKLVYLAPMATEPLLTENEKEEQKMGDAMKRQGMDKVNREGKSQGASMKAHSEPGGADQPTPSKQEKNQKEPAPAKLAKPPITRIYELEWRADREGVTITSANYSHTHRYLRDVNLLKSPTLEISELHTVSAWEKRLGEMDEVYVLEGTVKPILGVMRRGEGELVAVFAPHFLTNREIGLADNVVFAHNLIAPEGEPKARKDGRLYFLASMFGLRNLPIGVTGIFFFTPGGRIALFLLLAVIGFLLPRIFAVGRDYRADEDKFPSPNEKIMALGAMLNHQGLFKESFKAGISFLSPKLQFATADEFSNFLVRELGMSENEARKAGDILFSEAKATSLERQALIEIYRRILSTYKPRRIY